VDKEVTLLSRQTSARFNVITIVLSTHLSALFRVTCAQGRSKEEGQRGQLPRALRSKGAPHDDIYLF